MLMILWRATFVCEMQNPPIQDVMTPDPSFGGGCVLPTDVAASGNGPEERPRWNDSRFLRNVLNNI